MTGKKIRRWAWEKALEKQWFIIAVILVGSLPGVLVVRMNRGFSWPLLLGVGTPLSILTRILSLGVTVICLRIAKGEETKIGQILTPFSKEWVGKALLIVLVNLAVIYVLNYGTGFLIRWGEKIIRESGYLEAVSSRGSDGVFAIGITGEMTLANLKGNAIKSLGSFLRSILGFICSIIWFPVDYLMFLSPKKTGRQVIREGISLGFHSFWSIFKFQFWVMLPVAILIFFAISILFLLRETWVIGLAGIPLLYLLFLFSAYSIVAEAGFALTLLGGTIKMPAKKKRK